MKEIKKLMITLVALLAVTTGAWAQSISVTTEDFGKVICTDGSIYATEGEATAASKTAAAKIFFIDNVNKKGLALALADESGAMDWSTAKTTAAAHTPAVTGGTWKLATMDEWTNMREAAKNYQNDEHNGHSTFKNMANLTQRYWVNTEDEYDSNNAYFYIPYTGSQFGFSTDPKTNNSSCYVRACLEFNIASSGTAVEVAWDKAKKTGTFTMPGGNVTLEPEYYPQAALTAAPTAINDVPATTDGAIVKAGTVANIGTTETAQGTVMYYVSPTALDDAALLALAADKWTADVPTAEKLTKGEAYVYYYVRGNDSDTDEENFSDGDILAANALTVTIAAEPTYTVEFAEGTNNAPNKWTATPNPAKKGQQVTVTYEGQRKVMGVKAEKKAAEKTITIGEQNYTVLNGETWKQFITRNQLSGWYLDQMTLSTWGVYINEPFSKLHVSSDGTNWTQLVLSSQDAPIDTDKQYKWVQEEIGGGGAPF